MRKTRNMLSAGALAAAVAIASAVPEARAHPHIYTAVEATIVYTDGQITGLMQRWTFDELYTAMSIQGLDTNADGVYDRKELDELAKVNIDGIEQFDYFTYAQLGSAPLKFVRPKEFWLEHRIEKDAGVLTLVFMLPLEQPVLADAEGFSFSVYDPSYFIAFDLKKDNPIRLSEAAPPGCQASITDGGDADAAKALSDSLASQLGDFAGGVSLTKTVKVSCPKS